VNIRGAWDRATVTRDVEPNKLPARRSALSVHGSALTDLVAFWGISPALAVQDHHKHVIHDLSAARQRQSTSGCTTVRLMIA
jgi:hypothetical protein